MIYSTVKPILLTTMAISIFLILFISFATSSSNSIGRVRKPRSGISDQLLAHHSADHKLLENVQKNFAYGLALWNSSRPKEKPNLPSGKYSGAENVLSFAEFLWLDNVQSKRPNDLRRFKKPSPAQLPVRIPMGKRHHGIPHWMPMKGKPFRVLVPRSDEPTDLTGGLKGHDKRRSRYHAHLLGQKAPWLINGL